MAITIEYRFGDRQYSQYRTYIAKGSESWNLFRIEVGDEVPELAFRPRSVLIRFQCTDLVISGQVVSSRDQNRLDGGFVVWKGPWRSEILAGEVCGESSY